MTRSERQYKIYYDEFYESAYREAFVGQTTSFVAAAQATAMSHLATQRIMCLTDLYFLAEHMFGLGAARSRAAGIRGRKIWYPPIHQELCNELQGQWDSLIMLSRNMLKTTVAKVWVVQQILIDPNNVRIGMWSKSSPKVKSELLSIRGMLKSPFLLELFNDRLIKDDKRWARRNADALTVTRKVKDDEGYGERLIPMDESQIEVHGLESTVTGRHYTHHYYDDIIDRDNTTTPTMIDKARDEWAAIQGLKSVDTIEKIVGTPWHQLDLYADIQKEGLIPENHVLIRPGVTSGGTIIYPFYTKEWLAQQAARMGPYLYSCQYPLDTRPKEHQLFHLPVPYWTKDTFPKDPVYYIAVDPSTGTGVDKTGFSVGAVSRKHPVAVFFIEAASYLLKPEEVADELVARIAKYRPEKVGIEYGLQVALAPLIRMKIDERLKTEKFRIPIFVDIKTGGGTGATSKADKIDRTLGAMTRDQRALFDPRMRALFNQMVMFSPMVQKNEDDILDACSMLIQTIPYFHQAHWFGIVEHSRVPGFTREFFKRKPGRDIRDRIIA